jgi:Asp-tRNA(Asn)/Glu-tRNA(Gln) amidotransferase B subunit
MQVFQGENHLYTKKLSINGLKKLKALNAGNKRVDPVKKFIGKNYFFPDNPGGFQFFTFPF